MKLICRSAVILMIAAVPVSKVSEILRGTSMFGTITLTGKVVIER